PRQMPVEMEDYSEKDSDAYDTITQHLASVSGLPHGGEGSRRQLPEGECRDERPGDDTLNDAPDNHVRRCLESCAFGEEHDQSKNETVENPIKSAEGNSMRGTQ